MELNEDKKRDNNRTKCELMEGVPLNDHHGVFGIFVHHSCLQVHQNLVMALLMYQSQIVGTLHDQLDRNCVAHAKTIESIEFEMMIKSDNSKWHKSNGNLNEKENVDVNLLELNSLDIYGIRCLLWGLRYQHLVGQILTAPILVR